MDPNELIERLEFIKSATIQISNKLKRNHLSATHLDWQVKTLQEALNYVRKIENEKVFSS